MTEDNPGVVIEYDQQWRHVIAGDETFTHPEDFSYTQHEEIVTKLKDLSEEFDGSIDEDLKSHSGVKAFHGGGASTSYYLTIIAAFGGVGGVIAFLKFVADTIIKWGKLQDGCYIRIKAGDHEIEIKGESDIDVAIKALREVKCMPEKAKAKSQKNKKKNISKRKN